MIVIYLLDNEDLIRHDDKKLKHHALPQVIAGQVNKYGIVAFQHHLIGNAINSPTDIATAITTNTAIIQPKIFTNASIITSFN